MFEGINEMAVIVTAILSVAVGSIWYSPLVFGEIWMRGARLTAEDIELSRGQLLRLISIGILGNTIFFTVLAWFVSFTHEFGVSLWSFAFVSAALVTASTVILLLWEKRPLLHILVHIGYFTFVIFAGMSVIAYWPW